MARKTTTEPTPKTHTLTEKQLDTLRELAANLMSIRRTLGDLEGEGNLSKVMFHVGAMYNVAEAAETVIDELVDQFNEDDCEECGDDF
jgi:prefoldin subunit 5